MGKLILFPLAVLIFVSVLSMTGLGDTSLGGGYVNLNGADAMYYDSGGTPIIYVNNLTCVDPNGRIAASNTITYPVYWDPQQSYAVYYNDTYTFPLPPSYGVFYDTSGDTDRLVKYEDLGKANTSGGQLDVDLTSSLGMIALVIGLMALAAIVGLKVLGTGTTNGMVIVIGTAYLAIWGIFSLLALPLITGITLLGPIIYLVLTVMYTLGIVSSFNGMGGDD